MRTTMDINRRLRPSEIRELVPSDLDHLSDAQLRQVVDADLRRRVDPNGLSAAVSAALRSPKYARRWLATLTAMARSVEGQLKAGADEYEAQETLLNEKLERDSSPQLRSELATLRADYLAKRAATERFRTGLDEALVHANSLASSEQDALYGSIVAQERDRYARQVRRLERAIADHRAAVLADLDGDDPFEYDVALWSMLNPNDD